VVPEYFEDPASLNWGMVIQVTLPWHIRAIGPVLARLPIDWAVVADRYL
jgi:hypothetical protein